MNPLLFELIKMFLVTLIVTIICELITLLILKENKLKVIISSIIMNIVTNTSLSILLQVINFNYYYLYLIMFEVIIVIIESIIYYLVIADVNKAFKISIICNIMSYILGQLMLPLFI